MRGFGCQFLSKVRRKGSKKGVFSRQIEQKGKKDKNPDVDPGNQKTGSKIRIVFGRFL